MNLSVFLRAFGYISSVLMVAFGIIFLTAAFNLFNLNYLPKNFRVMFGIVFTLYGIFRFVRLKTTNRDLSESERDS